MPEKREGKVQLSVWVDEAVIHMIDERVAQLQPAQIRRVHRSDVTREVLRKRKDGQTPPRKSP